MTEIDLFTYRHTHQRVSVPALQFDYLEKDTENYWRIWGAGDLVYLYRIGERLSLRNDEERMMDAGLMVKRVECSLLLAKVGWFQFTCIAGWEFTGVETTSSSTVGCRLGKAESEDSSEVIGWFQAFSQHSLLRRAAEDAHAALTIPSEAILFMYRGFEWLKKCLNVQWKELGEAVDIPQENVNYLKKIANDPDLAARHASESGQKVHFEQGVCSGWICGLLHGIVHARCKLDQTFAEKVKHLGDPWPI